MSKLRNLASLSTAAVLTLSTALPYSCGSDAPPMSGSIKQRDSTAVMVTYGVSKLISDSGMVRYKILAEEWKVFDRTKPPRQEFERGIFLERFDNQFKPNLHITADTAYCYDQNLWELRGRVFIRNDANGTTFSTQLLYWDMGKHQLYSNKYMHIVTPDRELEGNWFRSNEAMTQYEIRQARGYMPMPQESSPEPGSDSTMRQGPERPK